MSQNDSTTIYTLPNDNIFVEQNPSRSLSNRDIFSINNAFNGVKLELSQLSMDLFFLLVTQVTKEDDELFLYETSMAEIQKIFNRRITLNNIQNAIQELLHCNVEFSIDDETITTILLSIFEYDSGTIRFKLNDAIFDILINQQIRYTVASLKELVSIKSVHAKRIYLLLKQFSIGKEYTMHLTHIYNILNLENKYERYSHFKNKILNPAIKSINEKTSLNISIYEHLKNRTVQRIKFTIVSPLKQPKAPKYTKSSSSTENLKSWVNQNLPIDVEVA